ncbi:hypothetical protein YQE_02457, partial [Dendroctonus ponderosae]
MSSKFKNTAFNRFNSRLHRRKESDSYHQRLAEFGMDRLQSALERLGVCGSKRLENNSEQALETRCSHV